MVSWKGGEHGYLPIIVYDQGVVKIGEEGMSHMQLGSYGEYNRDELRAYFSPKMNYLQITSHGPDTVPAKMLGWLYDAMTKPMEYGRFKNGKLVLVQEPRFDVSMEKTRVNFLGHAEVKRLGVVFREVEERDEFRRERVVAAQPIVIRPEQSIEGYMPSGRPIRYGDRRPVEVRSHTRRKRQ